MLLLQLVHPLVASAEDERAHQDMFRDRGAVDPGGCGDGDFGLGEQGMRDGEKVDQLQAVEVVRC